MRLIKNILDFYIFSNIHVALATYCLVKITLLNADIHENITAWFVFFSTLFSYNLIRFLRIEIIINWFKKWFEMHKKSLYVLTVISLLFLAYFTLKLRLKSLFILFPFSLATLFYVFPIKKYALRNIAGLKLFIIAISWAGITVLFPLVQNFISLKAIDYITFLQRFFFVVAITIPFDIRDLTYDAKNLKTLPQQAGIKKSKLLGILFLLIFFFLEFFKQVVTVNAILILLLVIVIAGLFLINASSKQSKYYCAFFVESIPILWYALVIFR